MSVRKIATHYVQIQKVRGLLVNIDRRAHLFLHPKTFLQAENISLEILKKIQDKKMEIDIEYEKTRDLYEK